MEQYSKEWFAARIGKLTSSTIWNLTVEPKLVKDKGQLSATTKDYLNGKLAERLTGVQRDFKSDATTYGLEMEAEAIKYYEGITGKKVEPTTYIEAIAGLYGGTPDGLTATGIVQIKCPYNFTNHLNYGLVGSQEYFKLKYREYYWQCQSDMIVSEREYCDFVSYCPDMPEGLKMFIIRLDRNFEDMEYLMSKIDLAGKYINETFEKLKNKWT
jgi:hypothetical protein